MGRAHQLYRRLFGPRERKEAPKQAKDEATIGVLVPDGRGGLKRVEMPVGEALRYLHPNFYR